MDFKIHHILRMKSEMLIWSCIMISLLTGCVLASSSDESSTQNDFRYVSYRDLLTTASRFADHNVTTYSRILFDVSKSTVIVGARDRIYRLSLQLDLMQKVDTSVPVKVVNTCLTKGQNENDCRNYVMALHEYRDRLFVCGTNAFSPKCVYRNIETLSLIKEENSIGKSPFNPGANITTLVTADGKMFVGSTIDFSGSDSVILRADLSVESSKILRTKQYNDLELFDPQFVGSFEHGEFVYFVFREMSIEAASFGMKAIYSRIGRVCKNDAGGLHILKDNWTSFLKARLNCSLPGDFPFYFDEVQGISYLDGELYATFTTPQNSISGSAICVFNMTSIETAFNGPIKYQEMPGSPIWQQKILHQRDHHECRSNVKSSSNLLDTSKYQLMENSVLPMQANPLFVERLETLIHISVSKVATKLYEEVRVIYVSNTKGLIKKISILPRTKQSCLIEVLEPEKPNVKIEVMEFVKATESLYVGTSNSILKIPSQRCSRHPSKLSCMNSKDPYCGWNDLSLSCTVAPNHDPLVSHWYQNATSCPILSSPIDGAFSAWSAWSKCAKSGDEPITGNELPGNIDTCLCRTRKCDNPAPKNGGKECNGHTIMVANCTQHGGWSDWSAFGPCSQTCGVAIKVRRRSCSSPKPAFGGRTCVGFDRQEIYCTDLPPCPLPTIHIPIDGQFGPWSEWSECSVPCGVGYRIRQRKCDDPAPQNGGIECIGCNIEYEQCNKQSCNEVKKFSSWTPWLIMNKNDSNAGHSEKRFRYVCKAPVSDPNSLKITLFKEETRACTNDGGCHRMIETAHKASWGCWSDFSPCSVSCGIGRRVRYRKCLSTNGETAGDKECGEGSSVHEETCEMPSCDSLIGWSEWSEWSACNNDNEKTRYRQCKVKNPTSRECQGNERETRVCSLPNNDKIVLNSSIEIHWIMIIIVLFGALCSVTVFFVTKYTVEKRINRSRSIQGSPHYLSYPNQYSSLPTKDYTENNKQPKRQPSFSGSTSHSKIPNGHGTLNKSNNNLLNQNTPKILKFQNDTDTSSTLKRNSALNNMRLKQLDDDKDKY